VKGSQMVTSRSTAVSGLIVLSLMSGLAFFAGSCLDASSAFGQTSYRPYKSTISPWMNLFQRNPGPLDNYHSYVQPQLQLQQTINQQNAELQQQSTRLQSLASKELVQGHDQVHPTGTGGVFMEYSHYFQTHAKQGSNVGHAQQRSRSHVPSATSGMSMHGGMSGVSAGHVGSSR
jgi:hypothetical protein